MNQHRFGLLLAGVADSADYIVQVVAVLTAVPVGAG